MKQYCLRSMRKQTEIQKIVQDVSPKGGGMLPSEMLLFASVCMDQGVTHIIESGRKYGFSTEVLSRCGAFSIYSIENDPIEESDKRLKSQFSQLQFIRGNGNGLVPLFVSELSTNRVAVLLDGPKNVTGCKILNGISSEIVLAGIHDVCKGDQRGGLNPGRITLETEYSCYFSDDSTLLDEFGKVDSGFLFPTYSSHSELLSNSCVLGVVKGAAWKEETP